MGASCENGKPHNPWEIGRIAGALWNHLLAPPLLRRMQMYCRKQLLMLLLLLLLLLVVLTMMLLLVLLLNDEIGRFLDINIDIGSDVEALMQDWHCCRPNSFGNGVAVAGEGKFVARAGLDIV
mmetsp:Transcript_66302/g.143887  ORF Transcript_66302/g.143887 Transcript_66302/m.143887 type:complete len:123 (-) Transcript_66302:423-791(-)